MRNTGVDMKHKKAREKKARKKSKTARKNAGIGKNISDAFHSRLPAHRALRFLVKFILFAIPLYIVLILGVTSPWFQNLVADVSYFFISSTGIEITRSGNFFTIPIEGGSWGAFINWDCTGWKSMLALFALIMATDFSGRKKAKGLLIFIPALFVVNIGRIVFMFHIAATDLSLFATAHAIVWSWGMIAALLIFWVVWMRMSKTGFL